MTEKERREKGLPPSPAQLALHKHFRKEAEEHTRRAEQTIASVMGPTLSTISEFAERMQPTFRMMQTVMEPMRRFQENMDSITANHKDFEDSMRVMSSAITMPSIMRELSVPIEPIRYVPERAQRPVHVHVEITEGHAEMIADKFATKLIERGITAQVHTTSMQVDLFYSFKERILRRSVGMVERTARFEGSEKNKRRDLFEKLVRAKHGIETSELKEYLGCPTIDATYKVIQGLNKKMREELGLTMNIADGSDKSNYRINTHIAIHIV